jgi:hypothetical protein
MVQLMAENEDIMVATRVSKPLYAKILKRQRKAVELTGIEPSISAIVRAMIAESANSEMTKRRPKRRSEAA